MKGHVVLLDNFPQSRAVAVEDELVALSPKVDSSLRFGWMANSYSMSTGEKLAGSFATRVPLESERERTAAPGSGPLIRVRKPHHSTPLPVIMPVQLLITCL